MFDIMGSLAQEKNAIKDVKFDSSKVYAILKNTLGYLIPDREINLIVNSLGQSYTDGKIICTSYPHFLPQNYSDEVKFLIMKAILGHEAQHVLSSDFKDIERIRKFCKDKSLPEGLGQRLLNIIEDGRIERILSSNYKGFRKYLLRLNLEMYKTCLKTDVELHNFFNIILCISKTGIHPMWYAEVRGTELEEAVDQVYALIHKGVVAKTSNDCRVIVEEIIEIAEEYIKKNLENQQDQDQGDGEGEGQGQGESQGEGEGQGQGESQGEGGGQSQGGDQKQEKGKGKGKSQKNKDDQGEEKDNSQGQKKDDKGDAQDKKSQGQGKKAGAEDFDQKTEYTSSPEKEITNDFGEDEKTLGDFIDEGLKGQPLTPEALKEIEKMVNDQIIRELDKIQAELDRLEKRDTETNFKVRDGGYISSKRYPVRYIEDNSGNHSVAKGSQDLLDGHLNAKREMEKILKNKKIYDRKHQKKGVLDINSLWKLPMKEGNVFLKKGKPEHIDYAFYILQDLSGSMSGSKIAIARKTLITLEEIVKNMVPTKIAGFQTSGTGVLHYVIKDFNDNNRGSYTKNFFQRRGAGGANRDSDNIIIATEELSKRTELRKVMFILSDGLPASYERDENPVLMVKKAVEDAEKKGIQIVPVVFSSPEEYEHNKASYQKMYGNKPIFCTPDNLQYVLIRIVKAMIKK